MAISYLQVVCMDPSKIQALQDFLPPRSKKDFQSFLGFCNFYRKFSQNHSSLLNPLTHLLKKQTPWSFKFKEQHAFDKIKSTFSTQVLLTYPNFDLPFCIHTLIIGVGAELFQIDEKEEQHTFSFTSRILLGAEKNYTITEIELLGIIFACQKFRVYIPGYPINVYTDHQALTFLFKCKLRNARSSRWTLLLKEYNLQIFYYPGKSNHLDTLSRHPIGRDDPQFCKNPAIFHVTVPFSLPPEIISIFINIPQQKYDQRLSKIYYNIKNKISNISYSPFYQIYNKILFFRNPIVSSSWAICVKKNLIHTLTIAFHEFYGHPGSLKTAYAIRNHIYFPSFHKLIRSIVRACTTYIKEVNIILYVSQVKWFRFYLKNLDKILVDIYGPLPTGLYRYTYIFVVLDNFTRYVKLYSLCKANASSCLKKIIKEYIPSYGSPKNIC